MAETGTKVPVKKTEEKQPAPPAPRGDWRPFESLRREVDRLFEDFDRGFWRFPFGRSLFDIEPSWRPDIASATAPAIDVAQTDKEYEITAELPGMDETNIEVKLADDILTIKGEKKEEKEAREKDYYLSERRYGSFQRSFRVPDGVDANKIEASFKNGVLR